MDKDTTWIRIRIMDKDTTKRVFPQSSLISSCSLRDCRQMEELTLK